MTFWHVVGFIVWTLVVGVGCFFLGGKHKAGLMAKAAEAAVHLGDQIKEAGKKL